MKVSVLAILAVVPTALAGPIAYGMCQTGMELRSSNPTPVLTTSLGCNGMAVACYAAAGLTFGTIAALAAPAAIMGCNSALGACSATCATVALLAPTP
jgi:hypothetical protein